MSVHLKLLIKYLKWVQSAHNQTLQVCSIQTFISGQTHVQYARIAGWRTSWNQTEHIETNQNKKQNTQKIKRRRTEQFQCRSTLECHQILLCVKEICMHSRMRTHYMQTPDDKCKCVAIYFKLCRLCTIFGCNKLFSIHECVCLAAKSLFLLKLFLLSSENFE